MVVNQDRAEAQQRRPADRRLGGEPLLPLGHDGEVDQHDAVLLHDADQQDDADKCDQAEIVPPPTSAPARAPTPAEGSVDRMVIGWMKLS